jgi:hypothetical protein
MADIFTMQMQLDKNKVLRRIFRPRRDEVTGEWRKSA